MIITHAEDPDGIIAATLLHRRFGGDILFARYDNLDKVFMDAITRERDEVYVADINPNTQITRDNLAIIQELKPTMWFDHHTGTEKNKDKLTQIGAEVIYDPNKCAAMLVARHYGEDAYGMGLAKVAQLHDYQQARAEGPADRLEKIICLANALHPELLPELVKELGDGSFFDTSSWTQRAHEVDGLREQAYENLELSVDLQERHGYKVLFANSSPLLSQKPAPRHLFQIYQNDVDLIVTFFEQPFTNHIVTATNNRIDVPALCASLGGGGRGRQGGFGAETYEGLPPLLLEIVPNYRRLE
jgi:hypothetical protein